MRLTEKEQNEIWHTKTCMAFNSLKYDDILYPSGIEGTEQYLVVGPVDDKRHIEGYIVKKHHTAHPTPTLYFVKSSDIKELPILITKTDKVHYQSKVYNLVTQFHSLNFKPEQILDWRDIIDNSGIPNHTKPTHYTLYKNKRLFARTHPHIFSRVISESAFGKDKYVEAFRFLLGDTMVISDPSSAKIFYAICHSSDITINELPDDSNKQDFGKMFNLFMRIGDKSNVVDNRARATSGTSETARTDKLSVTFTHNVPEYYQDKGKKTFEDIYSYNVINRYYYNKYEGYLESNFPENMNHENLATKHEKFYQDWIRSVLWYEQNWSKLYNKYPEIDLSRYKFHKKEDRFKEHFRDFAKCLSHYAKDEIEYKKLLDAEYLSHMEYRKQISGDVTDLSSFSADSTQPVSDLSLEDIEEEDVI